jgi:heme-degrading monooxygenase HmoA
MSLKHKTHDIERASIMQRTPLQNAQITSKHESSLNPTIALPRSARSLSSTLRPADVLALQRTVGNRAVQQILSGRAQQSQRSRSTIQAKLTIGPAGDHYEREADRIAATVMRTSVPHVQRQHSEEEDQEKPIQTKPLLSSITPLIQRQEKTEDEDEKETPVQRQSDGQRTSVESGVEHGIEQARGSGQSLPGDLRARMERSFGADFSGVRIHADADSDSLNRAVQARAFTTGQDLFFKRGEYNPGSRSGQQLIAHELTHVVQQSSRRTNGLLLQRQGDVSTTIQEDRKRWKTWTWYEKLVALIAVPIAAPLAHMWESGRDAGGAIYRALGKDPGFLAAIPIVLGALIGGAYGLVKGALRGLAAGIGNPLYSMTKRLGKGVVGFVESPGVVWEFLKGLTWKGVKEAVQEARGYFEIDTTHPKYGNLSALERQKQFFLYGRDSARRRNYNRDQLSDLTNYTLQLTGGTTSVTKFLTGPTVASVIPGLAANAAALSQMGAVGGVVGAATSLWDARKGFKQWRDTSNTTEQQRIGLGRGLSGVASATQQTATATSNIGQLVNPAVTATAQVVSGAAAIATGSVDIVRGVYGRSKATENIARLERLQTATRNEDLRQAARQAQSTQEIRKTTANWTIGKGVLGVTGGGLLTAVAGGLLAASMATPIGWGILAGAAVVGAAAAFFKWLSKRQRKKDVAMRELNVTEADMTTWEKKKKKIEDAHWWRWNRQRVADLETLGPDPLQQKLTRFGFKSAGHFYANYINYTANKMYDAGVGGRGTLETQINADLDARMARLIQARRAAVLEASEAEVLEARLSMLDWIVVNSARETFDQSAGMDYKQLKQNFGVEAAEGNLYPEVEELLTGMGLKFDFRKEPAEPKPEKIGKALHE